MHGMTFTPHRNMLLAVFGRADRTLRIRGKKRMLLLEKKSDLRRGGKGVLVASSGGWFPICWPGRAFLAIRIEPG